ncbi:methyltransferase-like 26 B [Alosa sapidissima]|uniref:methyltransferase-like 26 B n=1 Tax=Alosa sapidissima TaxID=34773 RepID=UPI001C097DE0|nr:methyltransferase-like 26 B [Alosa sapidissima]XP_041943317.1 methyltransferase-like 26 B [Alosa sapidissima]
MLLSPAADRNQDDILSVLSEILEEQSHKELFGLELGSGTGQHVVHFAQELTYVTWLPTDIKEESRASIRAYIGATKVKRVLEPVHLDASEPWDKWAGLPRSSCDVIVAINLFHVSSFKTAEGVFQGAGEILKKNCCLMTYGPYAMNGIIIPPCNEELDRNLRERNPEWGLPDIDVLRQIAFTNGMRMERMVDMPESNKCLVFRKI